MKFVQDRFMPESRLLVQTHFTLENSLAEGS